MTVKKKEATKRTTKKVDKPSEDMFEDVKVEDVVGIKAGEHDIIVDPSRPLMTDPTWQDYVMGFFEKSEMYDGKPKVQGLRRVAELLLGEITFSGPVNVYPSTNENAPGRATVTFAVEFESRVRFSDVADVWHGNTDDMIAVFPAAMASTRAEARALRKALRLSIVSADELTSKDTAAITRDYVSGIKDNADTTGDYESDPKEEMTNKQKSFIDVKCQQLNISGEALFREIGKNSEDKTAISSHGLITKTQAITAIGVLNGYQQDANSISEEIKGFTTGWND